MHLAEILGSKSKQQNDKNFNEMGLIFSLLSKPSAEANDTLTKRFTNYKKHNTTLKLLFKGKNKIAEEK